MLDLEYLDSVDLHTIPEYELDKVYDEVRGYCKERHIPLIEPYISTSLYQNDDRPLSELIADTKRWDQKSPLKLLDYNKRRSRSPTRNWINVIASFFGCINANDATDYIDGNINLKRTDGVVSAVDRMITIDYSKSVYRNSAYSEDQNDVSYGIVVGTGSGAESRDNYILTMLIDSGMDIGELFYSWSLIPSYAESAGVGTAVQARYFDNFSSDQGDIVVTESGMIYKAQLGSTNASYVLTIRDVLLSSVTVSYRQQLKVEYTFTITM